jgi:hypothetical protein
MPKKATAKKAAAPNFMETITGNAKVESKSKAKKVDDSILTDIVPNEVKADIKKLVDAKKAMKKAKSEATVAEKSIIEFGVAHKDREAFAGNFKKSYKIAGDDDTTVTLVTANKWSFNDDDLDEINEILGDEADDLIEKDYTVKIKSDVFTDEERQQELMALLGDRWNDFFETTVSHKPVSDFDEKIYKLGKDKVDDLRVYMKQSKPSVRG